MNRKSFKFAAFVLGAAMLIIIFAAACGPASVRMSGPSVVHATLKEMSIALDKKSVPSGKVVFVATNAGAIDHELVVLQTDVDEAHLAVGPDGKADESGDVGEVEALAPGQTKSVTLNLDAGRYVLICNIPGHYLGGMHTSFTVR